MKYKAHHTVGTSPDLQNYYYRDGDPRFYQRVWAGLVPCFQRQGGLVVVAEEKTWRPPVHLFWIAEAVCLTNDELLSRAMDFRSLWLVDAFYGRTTDASFMRWLSYHNADRIERNLKTLEILPAPNCTADGDISYHIGVLRNRLKPGQKSVHLLKSKLLRQALQELPVTEIASARDRDYPLLGAFAYVVAALDAFGENFNTDSRPRKAKTDYDIFNYTL